MDDSNKIDNSVMSPLLYYIGLMSYLLFFLNVEISWNYPGILFKYSSFVFLSLHLLQVFRLYNNKVQLMLFVTFLIIVVVGVKSEQLAPLILSYELIIGAKGIDFKSILKVHFIVSLTICLISIVGSSIGVIDNVVVNMSDEVNLISASGNRYSYGYVWPTGCAIHISFLCLSFWLLKNAIIGMKGILSFCFCIFFVLYYPQARQASFIILLLLLASVYLTFLNKTQKSPPKSLLYFLIISPLLFAIISLYCTIAFDEMDYTWMIANVLFSGRLSLGQDAINEYGITMFGQHIEMIGGDVNMDDYNYVDSSFVQAPLIWGVVLFVILLLIYEYISYQAFRRNSFAFLFAIAMAALSSVTSQYFFQIKFCPLLLALFASHTTVEQYNYDEKGFIEEADS